MWMFGIVVLAYSLTVYAADECAPRQYGDDCRLDCPDNCRVLPNISFYCNKFDGRCSEGCNPGFYGDRCLHSCSKACKCHICNQHNGHCTMGCIDHQSGDFCENTQDPTPGPTGNHNATVITSVAPTNRSSAENVGIQVIIPVVVVILLVLLGSVCTVIVLIRCRKRHVPDPEVQELLTNNSPGNQVERVDTDLHIACKRGNVDAVKRVLSKSLTNINSRGLYGWTPLMAAARYGRRDVFDFLVRMGCDLVMVDDSGNNILHVACFGGDLNLVKSILSKETVDINSRGHCGRTPIMAAARGGHTHVLKTLLSRGCDVSLLDDDSNSIIHYACIGGHLVVLEYILDMSIVDINSKGKRGMTPVMISAEVGNTHVFDFLVSKGADASLVDNDGNNILHSACIGGHLKVVQHILNKNIVNINSKGKHGMTPVMISAEVGHTHVFDFLVTKGADLSQVDGDGNNILHMACIGGNVKMAEHILSSDMIDINSSGQNGRTSLMWASRWQHSQVIEFLVSKGADASLADDDGNNILHSACFGGHLEVVQHILNKNIVDINSEGKHGMTAVMISVEVGHRHVFDFLVYKGADLSQEDDDGNNILHLACRFGRVLIVKYILSKGIVDINSKGESKMTSVMIAAQAGQRDVFVVLVSKGADMSLVDEHNDNILHLICCKGHQEMLKFVLSQGILDIDCTGRHMRTPVMMAAENGHEEVFNILVREGADQSNIDDSGNTILHLSCLGGRESIVQHILSQKDIDKSAMNNDGSKAVTIAEEQGHSSIYELLVSQPTN